MRLFSELINGTKLRQHWEKQLHTPERWEPKEGAEAWSVNNKYFMNALSSQHSAPKSHQFFPMAPEELLGLVSLTFAGSDEIDCSESLPTTWSTRVFCHEMIDPALISDWSPGSLMQGQTWMLHEIYCWIKASKFIGNQISARVKTLDFQKGKKGRKKEKWNRCFSMLSFYVLPVHFSQRAWAKSGRGWKAPLGFKHAGAPLLPRRAHVLNAARRRRLPSRRLMIRRQSSLQLPTSEVFPPHAADLAATHRSRSFLRRSPEGSSSCSRRLPGDSCLRGDRGSSGTGSSPLQRTGRVGERVGGF